MIFKKKAQVSTLDDALKSSWQIMHKGVKNFKHPFHQPVLATMDGDKPEARTVILREFSEKERTLICHCDIRSPKVAQITKNPNVGWLFYHPEKWLQLRFSGKALVHTDDHIAESQWKKVGPTHRINYCAESVPGSPSENPTSGLPEFLCKTASKLIDPPKARENFAVIACKFHELDWLLLKLTGNIRAKFYWKDKDMTATWVIP